MIWVTPDRDATWDGTILQWCEPKCKNLAFHAVRFGTKEVVMAAARKPNRSVGRVGRRTVSSQEFRSTKIYEFAQKAYEKTGGPTDELRRIYDIYLENQRRLKQG